MRMWRQFLLTSQEDKEKDLNIRLNHTGGDWDLDLLKEFDEELLVDIGFADKELDIIFDDYGDSEETDTFNLQQELRKVGIGNVTVEKGHIIYTSSATLDLCAATALTQVTSRCLYVRRKGRYVPNRPAIYP